MFLIEITFVIKDSIPVLMIVICLTLGKVNLIIIKKDGQSTESFRKEFISLAVYTRKRNGLQRVSHWHATSHGASPVA